VPLLFGHKVVIVKVMRFCALFVIGIEAFMQIDAAKPTETPGAFASAKSVVMDYTAPKRPGAYTVARFRLWHPNPSVQTRGFLVLTPGANGDGRSLAEQEQWQNLGREFDLGIVGVYLAGEFYQEPDRGSALALDEAIAALGARIGQKDLADLPLVIYVGPFRGRTVQL
jgi:hypothetical protein